MTQLFEMATWSRVDHMIDRRTNKNENDCDGQEETIFIRWISESIAWRATKTDWSTNSISLARVKNYSIALLDGNCLQYVQETMINCVYQKFFYVILKFWNFRRFHRASGTLKHFPLCVRQWGPHLLVRSTAQYAVLISNQTLSNITDIFYTK